jgi:hypothetical protein
MTSMRHLPNESVPVTYSLNNHLCAQTPPPPNETANVAITVKPVQSHSYCGGHSTGHLCPPDIHFSAKDP